MKLSAIVPVHNPLEHLERVMESLRVQTAPVDEVVVSDDGSGEDVLGALRGWRASLPFPIIYVRQPRRGSRRAKCRNNGIRLASGDRLFFLDQDILFTRRYLETFRNYRSDRVFLVGYPIRLSPEQSAGVTPDVIRGGELRRVLDARQRKKLRSAHAQELWSYLLRPLNPWMGYHPKLRSGVFGIHRRHLEAVNGFDETFEGWGNEDDDLGRRLYRIGVRGRNIFRDEFPLHLHHPITEARAERVNDEYYRRRIREIARGEIEAPRGLRNPAGDEDLQVVRLE